MLEGERGSVRKQVLVIRMLMIWMLMIWILLNRAGMNRQPKQTLLDLRALARMHLIEHLSALEAFWLIPEMSSSQAASAH